MVARVVINADLHISPPDSLPNEGGPGDEVFPMKKDNKAACSCINAADRFNRRKNCYEPLCVPPYPVFRSSDN
jgi:hypothetical protein